MPSPSASRTRRPRRSSATFKQPVVYTYTDTGVASTDAILNTTAANPPVIAPNPVPITFAAGKASHPFTGAGVGWLLVSTPASGAGTSAAAPTGSVPVATGTGGATTTTAPATLPQTGVQRATGPALLPLVALGGGAALLVGGLIVMRRRAISLQR